MATIQRIIARTHPVLKKGHAQIEVTGADLPAEGVSLSLFRSDRKEFLGPQDRRIPALDPDQTVKYAWQNDDGALAPLEVSGGGERLFLTLGKNVVVHMDQQSIYSVSVRQNGVPIGPDRAVPWRDVAPVDPKERGDILSKAAMPPAPPPPPPPPQPPVKVAEPPVVLKGPEKETRPGVPEPDGRSTPKWLVPALVVLALLVAGGAWYALQPKTAPVTAEVPTTPLPPAEPGLDSYLSRSPEEIVAEAQRRRDKSRIDEALFLLRAAGDKGHSEAQRQMAQIYDPTNLTPGRTTQHAQPDVEKAYGYYRQAIGKGNEAARADLARLRVTVERGAAQGDAAAARLLQRWAE